MKKIAVLGCTGSIGTQALDVIEANGLKADVLVANSNIDLLIEQARKFAPSAIGLIDERAYDKDKLSSLKGVKVAVGKDAFSLCLSADEIVFAAVGCAALPALMDYVRAGKTIALSNKECLVSAGELIMNEARSRGAQIIPVDSEHSAIWQCLRAGERKDVKKIILTASGGRYYGYPANKLKEITPEEAVIHPNWKMGKKISIDSATMMNKALEIIEASHLFGTQNIGYIIHPESIIHSMVLFKDGALMAQLSQPDMRLPISVALMYPSRAEGAVKNFGFDRPLTFLQPREDVFFAPVLAYEVMQRGGSAGVVLDAANEAAVTLFLRKQITFDKIACIVRDSLQKADIAYNLKLEDIVGLHEEIKNSVLTNNL